MSHILCGIQTQGNHEMKAIRSPQNPIIAPKDVKPSREDFEIIGVLNAGVTRLDEEIILLARFLPKGLMGILYWNVLYFFHQYVFKQMLRELIKASGLKFKTPPNKFYPGPSKTC